MTARHTAHRKSIPVPLCLVLPLVLGFLLASTPAHAEAPSNDDFADATVIGALPFSDTVDVSEATSAADDPSPSCGGGSQTIWYSFTPTETVWLEADPFDGYTSAIALFTGTRGALTEVACDFDFYGGSLRFLAQAGTAYYFMVSAKFFWVDWVTMNLRQLGSPPANDDFDTPTVVGALPYLDMLDTVYAGPADDDPASTCFSYDNTVWYAFIPARNMQVTADVHPTLGLNAYDAALAVYTGERGSLTELSCADVYSPPLILNLAAGTTYYFMPSTAAWYDTGDLALIIDPGDYYLFLPAILNPAQSP